MEPGAAVLISQASMALYLHALVLRQLGGPMPRWRQAQTIWKGLGDHLWGPGSRQKAEELLRQCLGWTCFKVGVRWCQMSSGEKSVVRLGLKQRQKHTWTCLRTDPTLRITQVTQVGNFFDFRKQPVSVVDVFHETLSASPVLHCQQQTAHCQQLDIIADHSSQHLNVLWGPAWRGPEIFDFAVVWSCLIYSRCGDDMGWPLMTIQASLQEAKQGQWEA